MKKLSRREELIEYIKDNILVFVPLLTIVGTILSIIIRYAGEVISYGYSSYYCIEHIAIYNRGIKIINTYYILIAIIFILIVLLCGIVISFITWDMNKSIFIFIIFISSFLSDIVIICLTYLIEHDLFISQNMLYLINAASHLLIFFIMYLILKYNIKYKKLLNRLMYVLSSVIVLSHLIFSENERTILYCLLLILFTVSITNVCMRFNSKNMENSRKKKRPAKKRLEWGNIVIIYIRTIIFSIIFLILSMFFNNELTLVGVYYASINTKNVVTTLDGVDYLCLDTEDKEIVGIPIKIDRIDGEKVLKVISSEYRYLEKYECIFMTVDAKVK